MLRFLKKFIIGFFTLVGISVISLILIISLGLHRHINKKQPLSNDLLLQIDLSQPISELQPSINLDVLVNGSPRDFYALLLAIKQAQQDKRVKGIIIRGDELSLGLAQVYELRSLLKEFKSAGKLIWFHIDSFGDYQSKLKLYYLASIANTIMMQPVGSVTLSGISATIPYYTTNMKKLGIKAQIATREEYKNAFSSYTDEQMSPAAHESIKLVLDTCFNHLINAIIKDRELDADNLMSAMEHIYFINAQQALKLHLVDQLMYWDQALDMVKKSTKPKMSCIDIGDYYNDYLNDQVKAKSKKEIKNQDAVALIYAAGTIEKDGPGFNPMSSDEIKLTPDMMGDAVDEILDNAKIKAVVIRIDSPGGSAVVSDTIGGQLQRLKDKKIPIIISMGNYAASGGYWIACSGDKIIASPLTLTGSIGVITGKISIKDMLHKFDVPIGTVSSGPNSTMANATEDYDDKQWQLVQNSIDDVYMQFLKIVAKSRGLTTDQVREVAKGRVWMGLQAKELSLVDHLGGLMTAIETAKQIAGLPADCPVNNYPHQKTVMELIEKWFKGDMPASISIQDIFYIAIKKMMLNFKTQATLLYEPTRIN